MKKRVFGKNFSRSRKAREAMFKALLATFLSYGQIKTTKAKATVVRQLLSKYHKIALKGTLAGRRQILANHFNKRIVADKLMSLPKEIKLEMTNLGPRKGDGTEIVLLKMEIVKKEEVKEEVVKKQVKKDAKNISTKK
jgi:ribosomal protein L17